MTPMIDIVFQLLDLLLHDAKVADAEGDFNIKMPLVAAQAGEPDPNQTPERFTLRMRADAAGNLVELTMAQQAFTGPATSAGRSCSNSSPARSASGSLAESAEVELDCDYDLKYEYVIRAITAVSGDVGPDGQIDQAHREDQLRPAPPAAN